MHRRGLSVKEIVSGGGANSMQLWTTERRDLSRHWLYERYVEKKIKAWAAASQFGGLRHLDVR